MAVTRAYSRKTEPPVETLVLAQREASAEDWIHLCEAIRKICISLGLFQANVELADERGLRPVFSLIVELTAPILQKWPTLDSKIMSIP